MCKAVIHYHEHKLVRDIDVSEKAGKVSKTTNALDVHGLPAPLKTSKRFLRRYLRTGFKQCRISWDILVHMSMDAD
ncbi:hypothetical protein TNCV_690591 [Trichonephila clavipes]|nr:hypothetical protein TNCV_690591 [Trichonephila clavipes]